MLDAFILIVITVMILAVLVPLALMFLLLRQLSRSRLVRRLTLLLLGQRVARPRVQPRRSQPVPAARLGRRWALLVADADRARQRFHSTVLNFADGPLRQALGDTAAEVDDAVAEAQRLASQGDRTDRAHRDVVAALDLQRRRARRSSGMAADLEVSLAAATRAQQETAGRLAAATARDLCQLQLVVARLHELTAHTLELATMASAPQQLTAAASIADRVAALRLATAEVQNVAPA